MSALSAIVAAGICTGLAYASYRRAVAYKDQGDEKAITCYLRAAAYTGAALAFVIAWAWAVVLA